MRLTRWCYRYPAVSTLVAVLLLGFALAISDTADGRADRGGRGDGLFDLGGDSDRRVTWNDM